jgi:hypothetical protein
VSAGSAPRSGVSSTINPPISQRIFPASSLKMRAFVIKIHKVTVSQPKSPTANAITTPIGIVASSPAVPRTPAPTVQAAGTSPQSVPNQLLTFAVQ